MWKNVGFVSKNFHLRTEHIQICWMKKSKGSRGLAGSTSAFLPLNRRPCPRSDAANALTLQISRQLHWPSETPGSRGRGGGRGRERAEILEGVERGWRFDTHTHTSILHLLLFPTIHTFLSLLFNFLLFLHLIPSFLSYFLPSVLSSFLPSLPSFLSFFLSWISGRVWTWRDPQV